MSADTKIRKVTVVCKYKTCAFRTKGLGEREVESGMKKRENSREKRKSTTEEEEETKN